MPALKKLTIPIFLIRFWLTACKPARELTSVNIKPIGAAKLLKNVENNKLDYDYFSVSRISCQYSSPQSGASFRINLKAIRDKKILASITKLNIPVGRVLLTPDSVLYVNFIDKNYFIDDYSYLSSYLNIDLDFGTIQSILSNSAFSYRNDEKDRDYKTFSSSVQDEMYVLESEKERKVLRLESKNNPAKIDRRLKKLDDTALILQKMFFNPESFALVKLIIENKTKNRKLEINFSEFSKVQEKDYPGAIDMNFSTGEEIIGLKVKMNGISIEKIEDFGLEIPEKYQQIKVN